MRHSENLIAEVQRRRCRADGGLQQLRVDGFGLGMLLESRQVSKVVASYVGENTLFEQLVLSGELAVELTRRNAGGKIRAGGAGIPGFTPPPGMAPRSPKARGAPVRRPTLHP